MQATRSYFPGSAITEETAGEYAMEWAHLVQKYGLERFEEGLTMARRYQLTPEGSTIPREFFPLPGAIEQFIITKTTCPVQAVTEPDCPDCRGTGWKYVDPKVGTAVARCGCRRLVKRTRQQ